MNCGKLENTKDEAHRTIGKRGNKLNLDKNEPFQYPEIIKV